MDLTARLGTLLFCVVMAACGGTAGNEETDRTEAAATAADTPGPAMTETARPIATSTSTPPVPTATPSATPSPVPAWPVTLVAGGDVMLGRSVGWQITEEEPWAPFRHVIDVLGPADIAVLNLETALGTAGAPEPKSYRFQAPPLAAAGLAQAGVDVVSLANNHAMDFGAEALAETLELLEGAGVAATGAGTNTRAAREPVIVERRGVRFAFLSYMDVPDEAGYSMRAWEAGEERPGVAWLHTDEMAADIASANERSDFVVVQLHFGYEYWNAPSDSQVSQARAAVDAGAALVVGSHPHVLQRVEEYNAGLIAYSLGNFVFDGFEGAANQTAMLRVSFGEGGIEDWELLPGWVGWDGLPRLDD